MNARERQKHRRIEILKQKLEKEQLETEKLVSMLIVNFGITRRTALEEVNAVKDWMNLE